MDRNREARRSTMAATNGLARRRHRTTSLRESPEEDVAVELQETARLRDRGNGKKDRDRERDRLSRSKRRRAERLMHGSHREDVGDESSEESVNDEEDDENEDCGGPVRILPPNPSSMPSISNHRKTFPPAKTFRTAATWRAADEMIGVSVPRKARSVSTKRSHDSWTPTAGVGSAELIHHRQASTSPARQTVGVAPASLAPASPSSSNASARKKPKSNGPKLRPPKVSSKSSPAEEDIEIEIAEVLYGMMRQPQGPSKQEISVGDSREMNKSTTDAKSRVSSPISNSSSAVPLPPSIATQNSAAIMSSISATAPKRKRPRPIKYEDENPSSFNGRNGPIFSTSKPETDHSAITEISSHNLKKSSGFSAENGRVSVNPASLEAQIERIKPEVNVSLDSKPLVAESNGKDLGVTKEEPQSPRNGTRDEMTSTEPHSSMAEFQNKKEEKFQIDLMSLPSSRSSPERNGEIDFVAVDPKSMVTDAEMEINKAKIKEDDKASKIGKEDEAIINVEAKPKSEDADSRNHLVMISSDKAEPESGYGGLSNNKLNKLPQKQHQSSSISDKSGQANSLSLPMAVAGWPSGLPPMGYVTPLPGVVSMDGSSVPSTAAIQPNLLFPPARPKRCATHFYIARNICYHQQIARMNPFWPAGPGSASMFGAKNCNLNVLPSSDFHPGKSPSSTQDKAQSVSGKDNKSSQPPAIVDVSQRKQILVQQSLPPGAPANILGPTFIFPLNQQHGSAPSSRPSSVKSPSGGAVSTANSGSASMTGSARASGIAGPPTVSFNYPNMPVNEAQYLAFLQNNGYSFPIPSHVSAPPGYRGAHPPPAMPFFNSSFYSSQMIQQAPPSSTVAGCGSSNQKHLPSQQQPRAPSSGVYGGSGNLQGFSSSKNQAAQPLQPPRPPPVEAEIGGEESPSADRVSRSNMNAYGQNFPIPIHPPNFTVINPPVPISGGGKKKHSQQQGGSKTGPEPAQAFALSFASINGGASTTTGIDLSTIVPNHPMSQNLPELTRQSYQFMAAAAAAHTKKSYPDGNVDEDDRKSMMAKTQNPTMVQSIAFSRADLLDASSVSANQTMVDNLARRSSGSTISPLGASNPQQQMQRNQQQMMLQKQQQFAAAAVAAARNKMPPTSNGGASVYSDHIPSSSSSFPQSLVLSNTTTSPAQSPQWKNSVRATSQVPSQSVSSPSPSNKNLPQQPNRSHTQISFAANPKSPLQNQAQQAVNNGSPAPSPPSMVGSPTSSISKSSGGSPRLATSTATGIKTGQAPPTTSQQMKNSQPLSAQKSILGNPHGTSSSSSGGKTAQQPQPQHLSKQSLQQAQLFFSHPYMQAQASHSTSPSAASAAGGYYLQRRRPESSPTVPSGQLSTTSGGMLSLCSPISLDPAKVVTGASAGNNPKTGGGLPAQTVLHPAQFSGPHSSGNSHHSLPAGFPYGHAVSPAAVQAKPSDKQPAGE